jgi:hypothetical protein
MGVHVDETGKYGVAREVQDRRSRGSIDVSTHVRDAPVHDEDIDPAADFVRKSVDESPASNEQGSRVGPVGTVVHENGLGRRPAARGDRQKKTDEPIAHGHSTRRLYFRKI